MAGCGACGSAWKQARALMPALAQGGSGMYMLGGYEDCTQFYRGPLEGGAIFVVAPASTNQRLFRWEDYEAAQTYAESLGLTQIDSVPVSSLCQQAVEATYA